MLANRVEDTAQIHNSGAIERRIANAPEHGIEDFAPDHKTTYMPIVYDVLAKPINRTIGYKTREM